MALISYFSSETLSEFLRRSNYWAKHNRNAYPLKIHKAISDLYEWIDCPCDNDCKCKKYQCEKHLVRKTGLPFDVHYDHFLECYVDSKIHEAVRQGKPAGRGKRAVKATDKIRDNWAEISAISSKKHLLCSNWCEPLHESLARDFRPSPETIYRAKWLSLLCFDTFVAYDNGSVALLKRDFQNPTDFFDLMKRIRQDIMTHLENTGATLKVFRQYDNPSEFFKEIPAHSPKPLGNIIDKLYLTL
jgi:hypothetical protein